MRVVSLLPSTTEIVYALGADELLVGVTFECDEPARARQDNTVVVGGLDTAGLSPGEIDRLVRERAAAGEDLYTLHRDALAGLAPDVILTQDLCRVCALPAGLVTAALAHLGCTADVVSLDPHRLAEVIDSIEVIGARLGIPDRAHALTAGLRARLAVVAERVAGRPRPRVAVLEWTDPPFTAGHWVPDLVTAAGGAAVGAEAGGRSRSTTWETVTSYDADLYLVAPCGYGLAAAVEHAEAVRHRLPPGVPVWAIDADGLVVRPGPRLVDGVEALAAVLHPDPATPPPADAVRQVA